MTPADVRALPDQAIVELLVSLRPTDEATAWLASVISDPAKAAGVSELSRRYVADRHGRCSLPRAKSAGSVLIDGNKFKQLFWSHRIPLSHVGPMIGKSSGLASVLAHKGRMSYWTADALASELGMHVDTFIAQVGSTAELERLALCM